MRGDPTSVWKLPAVAGVLYFLAFYAGLLVPNIVMFVPLLMWIDIEPGGSSTRRAWAGFVFGLVAYVPGLHYHYPMLDFSWLAGPLYFGTLLAFCLKAAILTSLLGWLRRTTRWSYGILLPLVWLPAEWLQTFGDLRMTGDHVYHSFAGFPFLVQFADLLGPYGVSAAAFAVNGLVYEMFYGRYTADRRNALIGFVLLVAATLGYDGWAWWRVGRDIERAPKLDVAVIQPNIPIDVKREGDPFEQWEVLERMTREAAEGAPDLIVWPESARPWAIYHDPAVPRSYAMPEVQRLARDLEIPLLVGAEYGFAENGRTYDFYNAALLVHADGRLDPNWGAKVYLVPFTEGVPFESLLGPLLEGKGGEWRWMAGGFTAGTQNALLPVPRPGGASTVDVGVLVCYEQFFAELGRDLRARGADMQAVITNDAWFGRTPFQTFQTNMLRLRAIENRTSYARAANTGYSGFVDPLGRFHDRTPLFVEAVEQREMAIGLPLTVYNKVGDVLAWVTALALVGACVFARVRP